MEARGDYIGGRFAPPEGEAFESRDPSKDDAVVLRTAGSTKRAAEACAVAAEAQPAWAALSFAERVAALHRFRSAISAHEASLAEAISLEMGKIRSEARTEVQALVSRFALVEGQIARELSGGSIPGFSDEVIRYRPHGVVAVLGPFNFPLHLCHAHVVPALLLGNAVVIKPSEVTPLAGQRYAEAAEKAGLPPGVINVVQGGGAVGAALVSDPHVHGLAFTGSWDVGKRIRAATVERPELLVALEMGGKNMCVVLEDADMRQAVHEVITSGYLTTGQRCTCSDRILVHESRVDELVDGLRTALASLPFGDPRDPASFAGPLATARSKERFLRALELARAGGAEAVVPGSGAGPGAFVQPSLHRLAPGQHHIAGYTDVELFGPDLCIETIRDDDEAIETIDASPFGFAISVFTQALDRFHRYETEARVGILNRNRSTNKASPRLPFGGVKKSGNFRPAGAWAGRNLSFVMAEIHNGAGVFDRHAQIVPHLPSADLDRLEAQHEKEEQEEAARTLIERPRPMGVRLPKGGELPTSSAWLARYYAGDRYVAGEKKPPVFDHLRSVGPWLVSIDDEPMSVLDGMSQTATSPFGFAPDAVVRAYMDGEMGEAVLANTDTTEADDPYVRAYADVLRERVPTLPHVSFANSGAEANEKAYALCRLNAPETAKKLLAFEGSFHGRTLLALYASHNPQKRLRFEIPGYEVDYAPAPAMAHGVADEPSEPAGWIDVWAKADGAAARERWGSSEDALLAREVSALAEVAEMLRAGEHFAVAVEPMQSEGGDRYLSSRFHRALRSLTRARGVSLIVDEVQCGHGLGGEFLWHQRFGYVDANGAPDAPDCVCFAKRAQLGVCLSRFEDPEPTSTFAASLVRGRLHAANIDARDAHALEARVAPHLAELEKRWGHRIENLRAHGYAIAFELASPDELNAYLGQRFWRGAIVFGAGTRTVRYRLSTSFGEREVATLFDTIHRSLAWLDAHPNKKPPAWEDPERVAKPAEPKVTIRVARADEADALLPSMLALEERVYEPARRDTEETLRKGFGPDGVAVVAEVTPEGEAPRLVGMALAAPADAFLDVRGVGDDPHRADSLYSISITVDREHAGRGLGRSLKRAQLMAAQRMTREDGSPRYRHACGRNRVPDADAMGHINDAFGAYTVETIEGEYGGDGVARYYRLPLGPFRPLPRADRGGTGSRVALDLDLAGGLARPLRNVPLSLRTLYEAGGLFGPAVTKITLLNYLTAAAVRATEWVAALTPTLPHAFLCSSRDETVDKSIRMLKWHRPKGAVVIGFEGAYVGHTSAGARSLSDPRTHAAGRPYFDWPRVPHPAEGVDASIAGLRDAIAAAGGPDAVLGVYASIVGERTGRVIPDAFWDAWRALKKETGIPLVLVETPSAYYRSGRGAFAMSGTDIEPDAMIWWTGGQLGFVHVTTPYNVTAPLTLVSTWDGDELSLIQMHHQLRAARSIDVAAASEVLERALTGVPQKGLGLYRVIEDPDARIAARLTSSNIRVRRFANGCVAVVPPLDDVDEVARRLRAAL